MSLGFAGAPIAAVVSDSTDASGNARRFVIGMERRCVASAWFLVDELTLSLMAIWDRKELTVGSAASDWRRSWYKKMNRLNR
jgi:hypothetical protein